MDVLASLSPERRRLLVTALVVVGVLVLGVPRLLHHGVPARAAAPPLRVGRSTVRTAPPQLVVDVAGAVRRPGLYHLAPGARVDDAVAAARGMTAHADVTAVNLAAPLADGEQVVVPARGATAASPPAAGAPPSAPVDLNTASAEQLDSLPGIGPTTAAKILAYRQEHGAFHSLEELDAVPGIGPSRIDELKGLAIP